MRSKKCFDLSGNGFLHSMRVPNHFQNKRFLSYGSHNLCTEKKVNVICIRTMLMKGKLHRGCKRHTFGFIFEELRHFFHSSVKGTHGESMIVHVQNQILTHHRQTDNTDVRTHF